MAKDLAIVLNSGSVNSAVATALAAQKHRLVLLHAEAAVAQPSPQPASQPVSRVRAAYDQQVAHFKPYREHTLAMPFLSALAPARGSSAAAAPPDPRQHSPLGPQLTELLPLVAAAARFAAHYQAAAVFLGLRVGTNNRADDLAQATEFVQVWDELLQMPCGLPELGVVAPLLELEAWQVVDVGFNASAPFEKTWSCQENAPEPCWACRGCRDREAAFQQAGKPDPLRVTQRAGGHR